MTSRSANTRAGAEARPRPPDTAQYPYGMAGVVGGYGYPDAPVYRVRDDSMGASAASAVTFLAGVWLVIAPFALDYTATGGGFDGYWNDVAIGIVIAVLALVRAVAPREVPWFSLVNVGLGAWLLVAPWVLAYNELIDATGATINDMVVGAIVLVAAACSAAMTYRRRQERNDSTEAAAERH